MGREMPTLETASTSAQGRLSSPPPLREWNDTNMRVASSHVYQTTVVCVIVYPIPGQVPFGLSSMFFCWGAANVECLLHRLIGQRFVDRSRVSNPFVNRKDGSIRFCFGGVEHAHRYRVSE